LNLLADPEDGGSLAGAVGTTLLGDRCWELPVRLDLVVLLLLEPLEVVLGLPAPVRAGERVAGLLGDTRLFLDGDDVGEP
jgi:hypothetical protein